MTAAEITRIVNSRGMVAVAGIIMLAVARIAYQAGDVTYIVDDRGLLFASPNLWFADPWLKMVFSTALTLATGLVWIIVIQFFNPFRALTTLPTSLFMIMMAATPDLLDQLYGGTLLCAAMVCCLALLWSAFADPGRMRHIFLLATLLSAMSMTQYCFVVYIPIFLLGCVQMKIFELRTVLAFVLGLITPWWIALGSGLMTFDDIHLPQWSGFFTSLDLDDTLHIIVVSVVTVIIFISVWPANMMKVLTLNANLRAFNGTVSLISLTTLLTMVADFTNAAAYLPVLYLVTAYQVAFLLSTKGNRSYVAVLCIGAVYIGLAALRLFV